MREATEGDGEGREERKRHDVDGARHGERGKEEAKECGGRPSFTTVAACNFNKRLLACRRGCEGRKSETIRYCRPDDIRDKLHACMHHPPLALQMHVPENSWLGHGEHSL